MCIILFLIYIFSCILFFVCILFIRLFVFTYFSHFSLVCFWFAYFRFFSFRSFSLLMQFESRNIYSYSFNFLVFVLIYHANNVKTLFFVFAIIHFNKLCTVGYATVVIRTESDGLHSHHYVTTDSVKKSHNKIFFKRLQLDSNPQPLSS